MDRSTHGKYYYIIILCGLISGFLSLYKIVKERGWSIKEDPRWKDRYWADYFRKHGYDALLEDLFLHEGAIPESERLNYSKHRRWGLLPELVAAKRALKLVESYVHSSSKDVGREHT